MQNIAPTTNPDEFVAVGEFDDGIGVVRFNIDGDILQFNLSADASYRVEPGDTFLIVGESSKIANLTWN